MGCNCGRKKLQVTSVNVSDTSGEATIGARDAARQRAEAMVAAAREVSFPDNQQSTGSTE